MIGTIANDLDARMATALAAKGHSFVTQPYVSTMTVCVKTSFRIVNVVELERLLPYAAAMCNANIKSMRRFRNAVILKICTDGTCLNVKIFINGTLHFTGAKCLRDVADASENICSVLALIYEDQAIVEASEMNVQMMNVSCKVSAAFDMDESFEALSRAKDLPCVVTYNKANHAAIKLKFAKTTAMVFRTGSISFMGNKTPEDFSETLAILMDELMPSYFSQVAEIYRNQKIQNTNMEVITHEIASFLSVG